jgi:predicted nicotinamide N-methyase
MDCLKPRTMITPREALGPTERSRILIGGQGFIIDRPTQTDRLLDQPYVHEAFAADEYLPYWADLWPAARMLAKAIMRQSWQLGQEAIELGCGLGLPGIVALSRGLRVVFSDYDQTALQFAEDNAVLNGYTNFRTLLMDWRCPPQDLHVPIILASDLIYEMRNIKPIVTAIKRMLLPDGICLLTDQNRSFAEALRDQLGAAGLPFTTESMHAGEPGGRRFRGTLYRIG